MPSGALVDNPRPGVVPEDWEAAYKSRLPSLQEYCQHLRNEVGLLLRGEDVTLGAPLEARVKSWPSILDKVARKEFTCGVLDDLKDLIGVRVILLYRRDIDRTLDLLRSEFHFETEEKKGMDEGSVGFGYQSVHALLRRSAKANGGGAGSRHDGLRAEVQVRTLAQHIWASASHDLQYKKEVGVPKPLRRAIQRVSALLETVDLELERVLELREDYVAEVMADTNGLLLDIEILRKILDARLPPAHHDSEVRYAKIQEALKLSGIDTVGALNGLLDRQLETALERDRQICGSLAGKGEGAARIAGFDAERLKRGVFYGCEGLVRKMIEFDGAGVAGGRAGTTPARGKARKA